MLVPAVQKQAGDEIDLTGTNLLGSNAEIGTLPVPPEDVSDLTATGLTLTIPDNALTGAVTVGTTAAGSFASLQKLLVVPTIDDVQPTWDFPASLARSPATRSPARPR